MALEMYWFWWSSTEQKEIEIETSQSANIIVLFVFWKWLAGNLRVKLNNGATKTIKSTENFTFLTLKIGPQFTFYLSIDILFLCESTMWLVNIRSMYCVYCIVYIECYFIPIYCILIFSWLIQSGFQELRFNRYFRDGVGKVNLTCKSKRNRKQTIRFNCLLKFKTFLHFFLYF